MPNSPSTSAVSSATPLRHWWRGRVLGADSRQRRWWVALTLVLVAAIGLVDYVLDFELSLQVFYILPICLAVGAIGWRFGLLTGFLSVASARVGDIMAGAQFAQRSTPWINSCFALISYGTVVGLMQSLLNLQRELEERVRQRTAALQNLVAERERLEKAVLEISERERRSIGHDLHDGLGQHLTGTALEAQVVVEKLELKPLPEEAADVRKLIDLIEQAIEQTRRLAKGLLLAEIQPESLPMALQELAEDFNREHRVVCEFRADGASPAMSTAAATHLFHIAKEAMHNAVRHGRARRIAIGFGSEATGFVLRVVDNGSGLPPPQSRHTGLGLSIMAHRAEMIGGSLSVEAAATGGTAVTCRQIAPLPS